MGRQVMEAAGRGGFTEAQALRAASAGGALGSGRRWRSRPVGERSGIQRRGGVGRRRALGVGVDGIGADLDPDRWGGEGDRGGSGVRAGAVGVDRARVRSLGEIRGNGVGLLVAWMPSWAEWPRGRGALPFFSLVSIFLLFLFCFLLVFYFIIVL